MLEQTDAPLLQTATLRITRMVATLGQVILVDLAQLLTVHQMAGIPRQLPLNMVTTPVRAVLPVTDPTTVDRIPAHLIMEIAVPLGLVPEAAHRHLVAGHRPLALSKAGLAMRHLALLAALS